MTAMSEPQRQAFILGEFADLVAGKVVYPGFGKIHVVSHAEFKMRWTKGPIHLATDWGRTPVCLVAVERPDGGLVVIDTFQAEDISAEGFWDNVVGPGLAQRYPGCRIASATGDPAGIDASAATETSPFLIWQSRGVPMELPGPGRADRLQPRIEATRNRLARLGVTGIPMLTITDNCKLLIDAIGRNYVYQEVRGAGAGVVSDVPTKSHKLWVSDLANALEYLCLYKAQDLETAGDDPYGAEMRPQRPMI
jgi:hypothetical protein